MVHNIKRTHKIFIAIFILAIITGIVYSPKLYYYIMPLTMEKRGFESVETTKSNIENQFVWFSYENGKIKLHYHPDFMEHLQNAVYMDVNNQSHMVEMNQFTLDNTMSGSMMVIAKKENWDIDGDGEKDSVFVSAKTDTNETQGWSAYSRVIQREDVPFEVVMSDKTQLTLLKEGAPYNGVVKMESARGTKRIIEVKDGLIPFVDLRDLRKGIVVTAKQDEGGYLIGSYICEYHTVFTKAHLVSALPLWIFFGSVIIGVLIVSSIRMVFCHRSYK